MNGRRILIISGIIVLLLVIILPRVFQKEKGKTEMDPRKMPPPIVSVMVLKPQKLTDDIAATGSVKADQEVELHSEVSGRIISIPFTEGAKISKGELLVKMYDSDLQAQLRKLQSQRELYEKNEKRQKQLLAINGISQADYDNTLNMLNGVKADIDLVEEQIKKTEIRSPFSGVIGLRNVDVGAYLTPSIKISTIQDIDPVKIDFSVPEKYMRWVQKGDGIDFSVQGLNDEFQGRVIAIEPKIEESTRSLMIRATCQNSGGKILPGAFAQVHLKLKENLSALLVPTESVIPEARGQKVFTLKGGKAVPKMVVTGIRNEGTIEIVEGLSEGDTIITSGIIQLKPGIPVKVTKVNDSGAL